MNTPPISSITPINALITVADSKQETSARLANIAIGQQVQGKVLSKLSDGAHLVDIQNTTAKIDLPPNIKVGDTLFMTLVRNDPRPTFLLTQNATANGNNPLAQGMTNTNGGVTTTLSAAAKLVETLTQNTSSNGQPQTTSTTALLPSAQHIQTSVLSTALQNTLQFSGLFYEAHVAQWVLGKRSLEELQKEPQFKFSAKADASILQSKDVADTEQGRLIQSQLSTLEQQKVVWQGEVWPGQVMEWEVKRQQDENESEQQGSNENIPWQSKATFHFEKLGNVSATLHLSGNQLVVYINTDEESSKNAMIANQMSLQTGLNNAGIDLKQLMVDTND